MSIWRQTGNMPAALADAPVLPEGCEQLWADFRELSDARGSTLAGPARISFADIDAWQRVRGVRLPAWQIEAIRRADAAVLPVFAQMKGGK